MTNPEKPDQPAERRIHGIAASAGIAIGRSYLVDRRRLKIPKRHLESDDIEDEIARFRRALQVSDRELERIKEKIEEREESEHYNIVAAHQLILRDEHLVDETVRRIEDDKINAEWALSKTVEHVKGVFDAIEDDYFRERRSDIDFVGERVMGNLLGQKSLPVHPPPDAIVVAHDLSPTDTAQLHRAAVAGMVTDAGGKTSHTAIVARAHEIPAVVGLENITDDVGTGDLLIVDGGDGVVLVHPTPDTVAEYRERRRRQEVQEAVLLKNCELPAVTTDDVELQLRANIDLPEEIPGALEHGARGVGLFRTEYLFMMRAGVPGEEEHKAATEEALASLGDHVATFRTFDLGADKLYSLSGEHYPEANPALGLRSLRLCLQPDVLPTFRAQLRGILRGCRSGEPRLMFPLISGVDELQKALALLDDVKEELVRQGEHVPAKLPVGIMIEMPSAVLMADALAKHVDFFSIGTNDLIQYTLAVDRVNEHVTQLYQPLHPSLLRMIDMVARAAKDNSIPVSVCGEMAGEPHIAPVLLGLGLDELSMNAVSIPRVKDVLRRSSAAAGEQLAQRALGAATTAEVLEEVTSYMRSIGEPAEAV